jgi:acetyl-CoA carboxylase biotin carboxyl carrier protein
LCKELKMAKKTTENTPRTTGFTNTARVKDLIALMADNGLTEIELVEADSRILLRRGGISAPAGGPVAAPIQYAAPVAAPAAVPASPATAAAQPDEKLLTIKSPMVGTYYAAPSPDAGPYVSIGSAVDDKTVVCIIEAMKVFNPIAAEVSGTITRILVTNGQVVEYGQPLFLVKP